MGPRMHGQEGGFALPWKMYKARLASFTIFRFAQKVPKSLPQDTYHRLKMYLNCDRASAPSPIITLG